MAKNVKFQQLLKYNIIICKSSRGRGYKAISVGFQMFWQQQMTAVQEQL